MFRILFVSDTTNILGDAAIGIVGGEHLFHGLVGLHIFQLVQGYFPIEKF